MNRMTSQELRLSAKSQLKGKIGTAILIMLVIWLATTGIPTLILWLEKFVMGIEIEKSLYNKVGIIISFVLTGPFAYGAAKFYLNLGKGKNAAFKNIFAGLNKFLKCFFAHCLMSLLVFVWSLLLIIPGFMAAISYAQTYYILNEYEDLSFLEAITLSRVLMHGYKLDYLLLTLTFIGWWLLVIFTFGFAIVFVGPYMSATYTNFYLVLKEVHDDAIIRFMEQRQQYS